MSHALKYKHNHIKRSGRDTVIVDRIISVAAVIYPLMGVPQIVQTFQTHDATGVSLVSWLGFTLFSGMFLVYGVAHRLKPIIVTETCWLIIDILTVAGIIMYGS